MRWLNVLGLLQLLCTLVMALPSIPSSPLQESKAVVLRAPGEIETYGPTGYAHHEHSLQPRVNAGQGTMSTWQGAVLVSGMAVAAIHWANPSVGYTLMGVAVVAAVGNLYIGARFQIMEHGSMGITSQAHAAQTQHTLDTIAHEKWKNQRDKDKAKQEDDDRAMKIIREHDEDWRTWQKWPWEMRNLIATTKKAEFDLKKAVGDDKYEQELKFFEKLMTEGHAAQPYHDQAKKDLEDYQKSDDLDERNKLTESAKENLRKCRETQLQYQKDYDTLKDRFGGQEQVDIAMVQAIVEDNHVVPEVDQETSQAIKEDTDLLPSVPGAFPERRSSNSVPRLIGEKRTDCDIQYCHRAWYSRHQPINKRGIPPGDVSRYSIHDLHLTPLDFEFQENGVLQRRDVDLDPGPAMFLQEEDCFLEDEGTDKHVRILMQYGGDNSSQILFDTWGPKVFLNQWAADIKKLPTYKIDGKEYNRFIDGGLTCWKFDLDGGNPAQWLAYTISDTTEYSQQSAESLLDSCKKNLK